MCHLEQLSLCRLILQIVCVCYKSLKSLQLSSSWITFNELVKLSSLSMQSYHKCTESTFICMFIRFSCTYLYSACLILCQSTNQRWMLPCLHVALILHDLSFCLFQDILYSESVYLALVAIITYPPHVF